MRRETKSEDRKKLYLDRTFKIYSKITAIFLGFIAVICLVNLITKDKEYSETENRMLAGKPELTWASLSSGDFMTDMEDYVTDQFILRNQWISLKMAEDLALGKRESNGVYIGKKGSLLEIQDTPNMESVNRNLLSIKDFAERHIDLNTVMTLVPNAAYICDQLVPANAPVRDQGEDIDYVESIVGNSLNFVDLTETLYAHKTEQIYYKTDHHWTSLGAKYAFEKLSDEMGIENPATDYTVYTVSKTFSGTLSSKSGYQKSKDVVEIYVPQTENSSYMVDYIDEGRKSSSMYVSEALNQKDHYEVFFGGNHTRLDILTPSEEERNLLIFKDSYANCFIQFLTPYYASITIIDPRYYYDDIDKLISENEVTDVLFLYNVNTFMTDNSLADVLAENNEDLSEDVVDTDVEMTSEDIADDVVNEVTPEESAEETEEDTAEDQTEDQTEEPVSAPIESFPGGIAGESLV